MRLLLIGPPGAGKGTQAVVVAEKFGIPHIATGDIFRDNVDRATPLGKQAKSFMDQGELVPDSVTNAMMTSRLAEPDARTGFLLDGYPRNVGQADELEEFLDHRQQPLDAVVRLTVDDGQVLARLLERARVQGRTDDTEDVIRHRLEVYRTSTEPLVEYYRERHLLREVDGLGSVDDVTARILAALSAE